MPSIEELTRRANSDTVPLAIQDLRPFWLFTCPICDAYTIHEPRLNVAGHWMVDHRREPVYQMGFDGPATFVGLAPAESCFVDDNLAMENIECTRAVIRVK
jgi:hypothetical protein